MCNNCVMMYLKWIIFVFLASPLSACAFNFDSASPQTGKCKLPKYPANGEYITDIPNAKPEDSYDSVILNVTCGPGFEVDGSNFARCHNGLWMEKIPQCIEIKCGTVSPGGTELIINGVTVKRAEVPWHAGIYTKTTRPYKQICGGSLVRNNIVVSAAHCFWSDIEGKLPATDYAVAVGKRYRPWIDTRDEAQQSDVKEYHLTDLFEGSAANFQDDIAVVVVTDPFVYMVHIRPVCVDFDFDFQESQLVPGHMGKVAGWGLTAENGDPSQVLKVIDLPYITTKQCLSEIPPSFHAYITSDKMCAGYKDGKALCKGDSGGGLAFPWEDEGIERYYLRGIVSTSPFNKNLCNDNTYTAFTLLLKHEHFVKPWLAEGTMQKMGRQGEERLRPVNRNVVRSFVDRASTPPAPFQHLTVDRNTGRVYIGALNRIHQLTPALERTQWIITGPFEDYNICITPPDCPEYELSKGLTDNANKVLVIDYLTSRLITCGNVFQEKCSVRNLNNISLGVQESRREIVAVSNEAALTTVAFIPPEPMSRVLYVGAILSYYMYHKHVFFPMVSRLSLEDDRLFEINNSSLDPNSKVFRFVAPTGNYDRYKKYVYGFSSDGLSYFLTTRPKSDTILNTFQSKLSQVCNDDKDCYSYTEIPIQCGSENDGNYEYYNLVQAAFIGKAGPNLAANLGITTQQDVLFAAFSRGIFKDFPSDQSALCIFPLTTICRSFMENIKTCFKGTGSIRLDSLFSSNGSNTCVAPKLQMDEDIEDLCGLDLENPLFALTPLKAVLATVFNTRMTALAVTTTGEHTVVFAGTADGYLKKILVDNSTSAFEYGVINVDVGLPINKDLIFDTQLTHLYVMTESRVSKVRIHECNEYKACLECLGAKDPFCGWRLFENECSLHPDGQNATQDTLQWISYRSGLCPTITEVTPHHLQRTTASALNLIIENLPTYNEKFVCAFTTFGRTLVTKATRTSSGVSCATPRTDTLPSVPESQHHFTARLSVRTAQGSDVVATEFKFFDCDTYSSCTQCVTSPFLAIGASMETDAHMKSANTAKTTVS